MFVGYDGQYYLCCSDWKKETPMGSVFDESFHSVTGAKLGFVLTREPVCKSCNLDPLNQLADELRAIEEGETDPTQGDVVIESIIVGSQEGAKALAKLGSPLPEPGSVKVRTYIPVQGD
jgi:hypothetical protein